ncbi:hypothetical protein NON20_01420 [Synechocystis sp. B12]|nr:hypothetical protein NON20_01420 [Synechocystis sp. B12]
MSNALREEVLKAGLYVARIRGEIFELDTPPLFSPKLGRENFYLYPWITAINFLPLILL